MLVPPSLSVTIPHSEDIKAALRKKFSSLGRVATILAVSPSAITFTLKDPLFSQKLEKKIAGLLEMPPQSLWPDRWTAYGQPIPRATRRKNLQTRKDA